MELSSTQGTRWSTAAWALGGCLIAYAALRLVAWNAAVLLADHDSVRYLYDMQVFLGFDLREIINLHADMRPLYPLCGAICSLPGWSVETGAELCSFLSSLLLFGAVAGLGLRLAEPKPVLIGLLAMTFSPVLISLSSSVLSEPLYIATVYLGLWLFWTQYDRPLLWKGALLGLVYGLAFLTRVEGVLYLAIIPAFQLAHFLFTRNRAYNKQRLVVWTLLYVLVFAAVALPQVLRMRQVMGSWSLSGAEAWSLLQAQPDGRPRDAQVYGLDYSPTQTNVAYLHENAEARGQLSSDLPLGHYVRLVIRNFDELYESQLGVLIGPFGLLLFGFGLLALWERRRIFEVGLILAFITLNLVATLLVNVVMRHIAIISPLVLLVGGMGAVFLAERIQASWMRPGLVRVLPFGVLALWIGAELASLRDTFSPPQYNSEYSPSELAEPIRVFRQAVPPDSLSRTQVSSRLAYMPYYAGAQDVALPYADYPRLVHFLRANRIDFLFLEYRVLQGYPFLDAFSRGTPFDFELLYQRPSEVVTRYELYRVKPAVGAQRASP